MTDFKPKNSMGRRQFLSLLSKSALGASLLPITSMLSGCDKEQPGNDVSRQLSSIRLQSPWINDAEFIGYFIAIANGYYRDENIEFQYLPGGPEIIADAVLLSKGAEIALTTPDVTINAIVNQNAPFKIIGAQYQKNPLGIVSLAKNNIHEPKDLIGKTLAAPPANHITVNAFLKINNIPKNKVRVVPYQYDPTPLINGEVDATLDFVTNVPYTIIERGEEPTSFLLYDFGFQIFNDTVVVREETLKNRRPQLRAWIKASQRGWIENFKDASVYPPKFKNSYFQGTGRSIENEIFFNKAQAKLMQHPGGIYSMSEPAIQANIQSLSAVGINATREMFVTDLV